MQEARARGQETSPASRAAVWWGPLRSSRIALLLVLAGGLILLWYSIGRLFPLPDRASGRLPIVHLTAGGVEIATLEGTTSQAKVWVPLREIPPSVVDAVLATEDRRFFRHDGVDLVAVLRAAWIDLRHQEVRQGASTITQQLARTLFLRAERTWDRKIREILIALLLEVRYSKSRILEAYLNSVYMGQDGSVNVYGVAAAARQFLGKDLRTVRLDEAALLAAAISAPNRLFSGDPSHARAGRDAVLRSMRDQGIIGTVALRKAMERPVRRRLGGSVGAAPYFVDLAREEIARRVSLPPSGEVWIATTLDLDLQRAAEAAVRQGIARIEERRPSLDPKELQAAVVAIESATGAVRALLGGRRYLDSPFNRAMRARRQPGSLFKPFVYLAAFEAGPLDGSASLTPASMIPDEPTTIWTSGRRWTPQNIDRRFHGPVTVRRALEESLNVPTVRVAQQVGLERIAHLAQAMGITSPLDPVPSLALGTSGVTPLEITAAFATLANQGIRTTPTTLAATRDWAGAAEEKSLPPPARVVSAQSSYLITHILQGVMQEGTARASLRWGLGGITAGKTGSSDGLRDAWFVGFTPDLVIGVWVGTDDDKPVGLTGAQAALPIWATVMQAAVQRTPPRPFVPPPGVVLVSVDRATGRATSLWCGGGTPVEEAFRAGTAPHTSCGELPATGAVRGFVGWLRGLFQ
jgi:1A family penicillin-binding protein